ncbi:MAG TPA: tetratricopeptide repeat protein [Caulobacteraceae bacterium]
MPRAPAQAKTLAARSLARANQRLSERQWAAAADAYRQVVSADPACAAAMHGLGIVAARTGELPTAIDWVRRASLTDGGKAAYFEDLCEICRLAGRLDDAFDAGRQAVALDPESTKGLNNLGIVHFERGEFSAAADCYRRALALRPDFAQAHSNLGNALRALNSLAEAAASYQRAVEMDPNLADAWSDLGSVLAALGRADEAIDAYRTSVAKDPLNGAGHTGLALQLLSRGDFAAGWFEYEWRWRSRDLALQALPGRAWQGEDLVGRRILLHAEQGLGDTIQFCRYARFLARRGEDVALRAPRALVRLLSASLDSVAVVADDEPAPRHELQSPLLSLPLLLGTVEQTIPAEIPYLRAPRLEVAKWRTRLAGPDALKVGVAWAGDPRPMNDRNVFIAPAELAPLSAVAGISWVSLQARRPDCNRRVGDSSTMIDAAPYIGDFLDAAAAISCLDLVICVDSAMAHLAGALGIPTWVLLPVGADWRWFLERKDSPWYPTMRLFRQQTYCAWAPTIAEVADALAALFRIAA